MEEQPRDEFERAWDWWIERQKYRDAIGMEDIDLPFAALLVWLGLEDDNSTELVTPVSDDIPMDQMYHAFAMQGESTLPVAVPASLFIEEMSAMLAGEACFGNFTFKKCQLYISASGEHITQYIMSGKCPIHKNDHGATWMYNLNPRTESAWWSCWMDKETKKIPQGYHIKFTK